MRYAKIAPAALHRGKFDDRCSERAEAVGRRSKFELDDFGMQSPPQPRRSCSGPAWPQVEQSLP
jgi:hypothetical protein